LALELVDGADVRSAHVLAQKGDMRVVGGYDQDVLARQRVSRRGGRSR